MNEVPLEPGETITAVYRLHWIALVPYILMGAAAAAGAGLCAYLSTVSGEPLGNLFVLLWLLLTLIAGVTLVIGWLLYRRSRLVITNLHVFTLLQRTLFGQSLTGVTLASVTNAQGKRIGILATFFNYGEVSVQTVGGSIDFLSFTPVGAPEYVALEIDYAHEAFVKANPGQSV